MPNNSTSAIVMQARWGLPIGYSIHAEEIALNLDALGVEIAHRPTPWNLPADIRNPRLRELAARPLRNDIPQLSYEPAELFYLRHPGYRIGFTMLEVDGLPDDWVATCNSLDEVWVPSHWGAETFAGVGVSRPIHVMPLGYDPTRFHPDLPARKLNNRFTFLSVFEWGERKAPEVLLRAYAAAFTHRDDVLLVLRVNNHDAEVDVARQIADLGLPANGPAVAIIYNRQLAPGGLGSLYCSADCFVLPTRGEGWGMPILEAMACGLPTIATDWSAQTEFFHAGVGYPLRVRGLIPADAKCPYYPGFNWAEPDTDHLIELLRHVYHHPAEARSRGAQAAIEARACWTWRHAAERMRDRLAMVG
ncbi:MAG TPA: glycosyltransferase [Roseiflexaceae bacterium]|nr:glycosyltransferase [Roseiflexaceae bacterium]HMP42289.1 glycosyltransferase [Roseiflexaceae bacterium]